MKSFIKYSILSAVILIYGDICGQNVWSLEKCIEYAKEHNLQIRQQQLSVEQSRNLVKQAKYEFLPSLSFSASQNLSWGRSVDLQSLEIIKNKLSASTSASLGSQVTIFNGLSNVNNLRSNQKQLEISNLQVELLENNISLQITQAYLQLLLAQAIEASAKESYKSVEQQVERTAKMVDAGSQAYSTLLEVRSQLASEKSQVVEAQNGVRTAKLSLIQLLDYNPTNIDSFSIEEPKIDFDETMSLNISDDISGIYSKALQLPQIKIQELSVEKGEYDYKSAVGRFYPTLSVNAGYGSYYTKGQEGAFFNQFDHNRNPTVGFNLSIPIFNALTTRLNVRNQKIQLENQKIELELQKKNLYKEIQSAYNEAYSAYEKMNAAKENLLSIQESFTYTENKFNVGMVNATDYNIARANLFKATSSYLQAKFQYIFELKILDFYTGNPLTL